MDPDLIAGLAKLAKIERVPMASIVRRALRRELQRAGVLKSSLKPDRHEIPKQGAMTPNELFDAVGLSACGPVRWGEPCGEHEPGVYVIAIGREIVYIGRTKRSLARRIREFYNHRHGDPGPHRGGQAVLLMPGDRTVYWSPTNDSRDTEKRLIQTFVDHYGRLPTANRRRGDERSEG